MAGRRKPASSARSPRFLRTSGISRQNVGKKRAFTGAPDVAGGAAVADWQDLVREHVKDPKYQKLILAQLDLVKGCDADRLALAEWVRHLATTPARRGEPLAAGVINNMVQAVAQFLRDRQGKPARETTEEEYQSYFIRRAKRPGERGKGRPGEPGKLNAKSCYYHERYVRRWLAFVMGQAEVDARIRRVEIRQHQEASLEWIAWRDVERIAETLPFQERALLTMMVATPLSPQSLISLTANQARSDGGLVYFDLPANPACPLGHVVPLHHGDETIAAHVRLRVREAGPQAILWPLTTKQLTAMVEGWGRQSQIPNLSRRRLMATCLATLMAEGASDQFLRHLMGIKDIRLIHKVRARVQAAQKLGQDFCCPAPTVPEIHGGAVPCSACGKLDNPVGNVLCGYCGNRLSNRSLGAEEALKASILNRVGRLLDITGQSSRDRLQEALNIADENKERPKC